MMNSLEVRAPFLDIGLVDLYEKYPTPINIGMARPNTSEEGYGACSNRKRFLYRSKKGFGVRLVGGSRRAAFPWMVTVMFFPTFMPLHRRNGQRSTRPAAWIIGPLCGTSGS